ncbi:hypothetical protein DFH07DRAFT_776607 [Mycena maculata]|uniref:Uncharacterized protein n=1 Tax=Mycena maculata TaxID=230809 RepID=A0AAD7ILY9_9AGAR|nr:hypothetical protein DFH07DRAFT_776607 [Mycena maculata]
MQCAHMRLDVAPAVPNKVALGVGAVEPEQKECLLHHLLHLGIDPQLCFLPAYCVRLEQPKEHIAWGGEDNERIGLRTFQNVQQITPSSMSFPASSTVVVVSVAEITYLKPKKGVCKVASHAETVEITAGNIHIIAFKSVQHPLSLGNYDGLHSRQQAYIMCPFAFITPVVLKRPIKSTTTNVQFPSHQYFNAVLANSVLAKKVSKRAWLWMVRTHSTFAFGT